MSTVPDMLQVRPRYPNVKARNQWALLEALRRGERITLLDSYKFGVAALSQECGRLRKLGWPVCSERIKTPTGKHIAQYFLWPL